ncbi:MAG: DUF2213 domain-containing protein [Desulfovibrionaceae bacterium]|nr:DUF2213 domain-containing protein [Desulfovibrionaceae bacterium]
MRYYTTHDLSPHIQETPEGFLLCSGVPIARTGVQEYTPDEVPVEPGPDGVVLVVREEAEVFSPATIASFEGKSVTLYHPEPDPDPDVPDVNPDNWRELARGVAMNVRRGEGSEADLLLADLLVTDAEAIAAVLKKRLRQVSCGYDADYEEIRPGVGRQVNIIGNHIALVPHGRAGGRVGIKDARPDSKETKMTKKTTGKKTGFWDRFTKHLKAGKTTDEAAAAAVSDEAQPESESQENAQPATDSGDDALAALTARVEELELVVRTLVEGKGASDAPVDTDDVEPEGAADEEPEEETPCSTKTGDARRMRVADAAAVRRAVTISPGLAARVGDGLVAVQKQSLRRALQDEALKGVVSGVLAGRTLDSLSQAELNAAFCATAEVARHVNNAKTADGLTKASVRDFGKQTTPEDINALNAQYYGRK